MQIAAVLGLLIAPGIATANPVTAGVSLGMIQTQTQASDGLDPNGTLGLYGRLGLTRRLSIQLDILRFQFDELLTIRSATTSIVFDIGSSRWLVPVLHAGLGGDAPADHFDSLALHADAGVGLELRFESGFTLGADVSAGARGRPMETSCIHIAGGVWDGECYDPLRQGTYRAAKLTIGARF